MEYNNTLTMQNLYFLFELQPLQLGMLWPQIKRCPEVLYETIFVLKCNEVTVRILETVSYNHKVLKI
jgi:hypothetical protein